MKKIAVLKIAVGADGAVCPTAIADDRDVILIDCAFKGDLPKMKGAAIRSGIDLDRVTAIIITHHDHDHTGTLHELKAVYPNMKVISSAIEAEYITGQRIPLRLKLAQEEYPTLPDALKEENLRRQQLYQDTKPLGVDIIVKDGDVLPYCGGIEVISTPGHMPGHISLYAKEFKTLITGDAMTIVEGKLSGANPKYTLDMPLAVRCIRNFLNYDIGCIICHHGGKFEGDVKDALLKIVSPS